MFFDADGTDRGKTNIIHLFLSTTGTMPAKLNSLRRLLEMALRRYKTRVQTGRQLAGSSQAGGGVKDSIFSVVRRKSALSIGSYHRLSPAHNRRFLACRRNP